ncbi:MAG: 50S ribosomal protein L13 [Candidatus Woesearchaeota archaeon]
MMKIIDAKDIVLGRVGSHAAKIALLGDDVSIINCELARVTGDEKTIFAHYRRRVKMGIYSHGPFLSRKPEMFVKRSLRGMLPYKQPRGAIALKRIKCYKGTPDIKGEAVDLKDHHISKVPSLKHTTVKAICLHLGGKE